MQSVPQSRNLKSRARDVNQEMLIDSTTLTRKTDESTDSYLKRITHLHLQNKRIKIIEGLEKCKSLKVLYLYENLIEQIDNVNLSPKLQYLNLQNNFIRTLPDLNLPELVKLFLDNNEITFLAGLQKCEKLEELHISNQRFQEMNDVLQFEPISLQTMSYKLQCLDISGNNISILEPFKCLKNLIKINASNNNIDDIYEMIDLVEVLTQLKEIDFTKNPCNHSFKYRDSIMAACSNKLILLDDIPVTDRVHQTTTGLSNHRQQLYKQSIRLQQKAAASSSSSTNRHPQQQLSQHYNDHKDTSMVNPQELLMSDLVKIGGAALEQQHHHHELEQHNSHHPIMIGAEEDDEEKKNDDEFNNKEEGYNNDNPTPITTTTDNDESKLRDDHS